MNKLDIRDLKGLDKSIWLAVIVAALGYFVDIYDLLLFSIVRMSSLKGIGVADHDLMSKGILLINVQMAGLFVGGILWGVIGDKRGRLSVLFGSIVLYSTANIANAFVTNIEQYAVLRFIAGIGLAGELGAGITLVSEILPQRLRGYGTSIVASIGLLGAVFGGLVGDIFHWRTAYVIGGVLGFLILLLRFGVVESGMFKRTKDDGVHRGRISLLFRRETIGRYLAVILIGVPTWYVIGILATFAPEMAKSFGMSELPTAGRSVMFAYIGLSFGDLTSGLISQYYSSRRKAIFIYFIGIIITTALYMFFARESVAMYYAFCVALGFFAGYWAMFVTVGAEQFGTNIRSTVATTAPNFVRGAVILLTSGFEAITIRHNATLSAVIVGLVTMVIAMIALKILPETFHKNLDYNEE